MKQIQKLLVCGVGLIGGSFAMAARKHKLAKKIIGIGRSPDAPSLAHARDLGVIDEIASGWNEALDGTDLVVLAAPVGQINDILATLSLHLASGTLVTDVGSTKGEMIESIYRHLPHHLPNIVPGHPIAGAEHSGVEAASADLFERRRIVLTPLPENDPAAVLRVRAIWQKFGAEVNEMHPQEHDRVFAAVSHLPHLLAFGLVHNFAQRANADQLFSLAAGGFRDFTRIASSHPEMWRDICIANRQPLLAELDQYLSELAYLRSLLLAGKSDLLFSHFAAARDARNDWLARAEVSPPKDHNGDL